MSREETFWNRVIELSKKTFKKEIFDYFVLTSRLIKVDQQEAVIYLDAESKEIILGREYDKGDSDCWF